MMTESETLARLYAALQTTKPGIRDLPVDDRREYMKEAKRRSRQKAREAAETGSPEPTSAAVRAALADAAIMLLVDRIQRLVPTPDGGDDFVGVCGP